MLAVAAGTGDVLMARLLPAGDGGASVPRERSRCGPTAASILPLSQDGCPLLHHHPLQHPRLRNLIEAIPETDWTPIPYWMDGAASVADHLHSLRQSTRRRTSAPHRPQGEAHARLPTGVFHQLQLSHHGPRGRHPWKPTTAVQPRSPSEVRR